MNRHTLFFFTLSLIPRSFSPSGVLKDYLRELPHPLISKPLYEAVLDAMSKRPLMIGSGGCENDLADSEHAAGLLETLPEVEKVTRNFQNLHKVYAAQSAETPQLYPPLHLPRWTRAWRSEGHHL